MIDVKELLEKSNFEKGSDEDKVYRLTVKEMAKLFKTKSSGVIPYWKGSILKAVSDIVPLPYDYKAYTKKGFIYLIQNDSPYGTALKISLDKTISEYIDDIVYGRNKKVVCHPCRMIKANEIESFIKAKYKGSIKLSKINCTSAIRNNTVVYTLQCAVQHSKSALTCDTTFCESFSIDSIKIAAYVISKKSVRIDYLNKLGCLGDVYNIINLYDDLYAYKTDTFLKVIRG